MAPLGYLHLMDIGDFTLFQLLRVLGITYCRLNKQTGCLRKERWGYMLPKDVTPAEWDQFLYTFNHIKHLDLKYFAGVYEILDCLPGMQLLRGGELVPNFQTISIGNSININLGDLRRLCFSESLKTVSISESGRRRWSRGVTPLEDTTVCLAHLLSGVPDLRHITITAFSLNFAFDSFVSLTSLRIGGSISAHSFYSIFGCPQLRQLSFGQCTLEEKDSMGIRPEHPAIVHHGLHELEVQDLGSIENAFLESIALPSLTKLSILSQRLGCHKAIALLTHLRNTSPHVSEISLHTHGPATIPLLSCISAFDSVKAVMLNQDLRYGIESDKPEDEEIVLWLESLHHMELLEWVPPGDRFNRPILDLHHLLSLATHAPKLRRLSAPLYAHAIEGQLQKLKEKYGDLVPERKRRPHNYFTSLRRLDLFIFHLESLGIDLLAELLVAIIPHNAELHVHVVVDDMLKDSPEKYVEIRTKYQTEERRLQFAIESLRTDHHLKADILPSQCSDQKGSLVVRYLSTVQGVVSFRGICHVSNP